MVNNAAEARAAAQAMRYPPVGDRSTADPLAIHYPGDYGARANDEVFLAVQIETAAGLENVEEIMAVDGVDATLIGPADLALTIGAPIGSAAHDAAIRRVLAACQASGKIPGMFAATTEIARRWIEEGFLFVTVSGDFTLLNLGAKALLNDLADLL
jgi:4-hydroxy-2-oxoheptanedioate aldolase